MAVTTFKPEIWAQLLLATLDKALVYGQAGVVNRDYEGEISQQGDTVRIGAVDDPTIGDYTGAAIVPEDLTTTEQTMPIDQAKFFAFKLDDVDRAQVASAGGLMQESMRRAAFGLRDVADQYIASLYTGVAAGNTLGTVAVTTGDIAYGVLRDLGVLLDEADVPMEGRYVVVPPWFHGLLLDVDRFVRADAYGSTRPIRNGEVGEALGFRVLKSNNTPNPAGDDNVVQAGYSGAISYAEQIVDTEAFRSQDFFADVVRGLHVYGAKLTRPTGIATCVASQT
ncbi:MAG: P22 coat protein - protein 5 domain protein [Actinomycetota bacterium]